jgi:putative SOS response-associated peptidase YedK
MCSNYHSARVTFIESVIAEDIQSDVFADHDVWPGYSAPVILLDKGTGQRRAEPGIFGLVPHWAKDLSITRNTFNARSETVTEKPSFKLAWSHANFCLIPATFYREPKYDADGKNPQWWSIARNDAPDFCIAGIYWRPKGEGVTQARVSFSMLTMNCDGHPILAQFHDPRDEKRSIVHVLPEEYDAWLTATTELARVMLTLPDEDRLVVAPAPLPPRKKKSAPLEG